MYLGLILHSLLNYFGTFITGRLIEGSHLIGGRLRFDLIYSGSLFDLSFYFGFPLID